MKHFKQIMIVAGMISLLTAANLQNQQEMQQQDMIKIIPSPVVIEGELDPLEYIIGVGDQFMVEKLQDKSTLSLPVSPTGNINVPGRGSVKVSGLTLAEAKEAIRDMMGPYSNVFLYSIKTIRIPVTGAVKVPGIYAVSAAWRLSDLLKKVPLRYLGKDFAIEIRSEADTQIVNIYDFYLKGKKESNPYLHSGETVYIPFADLDEECVEVYGPVMVESFVPFIQGETLGEFYRRKIRLSDVADYQNITVMRGNEIHVLKGREMDSFVLKPLDRIEFAALKRIMVTGHVNRPGTYDYVPGHTVVDYIAMAGGVNFKGSNESAIIIRDNTKIRKPLTTDIRRGDIILVKRSAEDILIGEISILSFVSMLASIASTVITAFIAAGNL